MIGSHRGYETFAVGERVDGFQVETILRYQNGQPVYGCRCLECGSSVPIRHAQFSQGTARCTSSIHGKPIVRPSSSSDAEVVQIATASRSEQTASAKAFLRDEHQREHAQFVPIRTYEMEWRDRQKAEAERRWQDQVERDRTRYMRYKRHAILEWNQAPEKVPSFAVWLGLAERSKEQILEKVEREEQRKCANQV